MSGEVKSEKLGAIQIMESLKWNSNLQNLETMVRLWRVLKMAGDHSGSRILNRVFKCK